METMHDVTIDEQSPDTQSDQLQDAPASIADHAAQFGEPVKATPQAPSTDQPVDRQSHHSDTQRRDKANGQFAEGHRRRSKDTAHRIDKLTGRAKTAEDRVAELEAQMAQLRAQPQPQMSQPQPQAQPPQRQVVRGDAEPSETDPKYRGNTIAYLDDRARWVARQEFAAQRQRDQQEASGRALLDGWATRLNAAKSAYQDYDQVALGEAVPWLDAQGNALSAQGAAIDSWIMQHAAGPHVLYYLQSHPQERDALMRKPILHVMEDLALLSQRFASKTPSQAGATGSVAGRTSGILPKPPNPVRTEAQHVGHAAAPPTDGSLSIAAHRKAFGPQR